MMVSSPYGWIVRAVLVATCGALIAWGIHGLYTGRKAAEVQRDAALARAAVAETDLSRLQAAQVVGDTLTRRLLAAETATRHAVKERDRAIHAQTSGAACLHGGALRLLHGSPGIRVQGLLPGAAGGAVASGAAAATAEHSGDEAAGLGAAAGQSGFLAFGDRSATDREVVGWIIQAGAAHETCRQRLQALIDFHGQTTEVRP